MKLRTSFLPPASCSKHFQTSLAPHSPALRHAGNAVNIITEVFMTYLVTTSLSSILQTPAASPARAALLSRRCQQKPALESGARSGRRSRSRLKRLGPSRLWQPVQRLVSQLLPAAKFMLLYDPTDPTPLESSRPILTTKMRKRTFTRPLAAPKPLVLAGQPAEVAVFPVA